MFEFLKKKKLEFFLVLPLIVEEKAQLASSYADTVIMDEVLLKLNYSS